MQLIRRSLLAAALAGAVSLLLHGLGLTVASTDLEPGPDAPPAPPPRSSAAFEDFAEPAPEPPPPEVTAPDPVEPLPPTSTPLVASDTPQNVTTPDTGTEEVVAPEAASPAEPVAPDPSQAAGAEAEAVAEASPEPVEAETTPETTPVEASETNTETTPDEAAEPVQPDLPDTTIPALPDAPEIQAEPDADSVMETAVTSSLRPPRSRPKAAAPGATGPAQQDGSSGPATPVIEGSSLDLLARESIISTGRATGNAGTTNYAGKVLTQLNRARHASSTAEGRARVQFQIDPDGSVAWVRILRSSGSQGLDRAAAEQVRRSAPFPRPPGGEPRRLTFIYHSD